MAYEVNAGGFAGSIVESRFSRVQREHAVLLGILCRDPTSVEIELLARAGYHAVWMDLEHSAISISDAAMWCRAIARVGMIPVIRIPEITRHTIQCALEAGYEIVVVPHIETEDEARELVRLARYPPTGDRSVSSTQSRTGFTLGGSLAETLRLADESAHLMVQIESERGLQHLDAILSVPGIDMITVGPLDWSVSLGLYGPDAQAAMSERVEAVLKGAAAAGKTTGMLVRTVEEARLYRDLGVRILFLGVDVAVKREAFTATISRFAE